MAEKLFNVLAGKSADYFELGGVPFEAAPFTMLEYTEFLAIPDGDMGERAAFIAAKLRARIRGTKHDPVTITADWVLENLPLPTLAVLQHIFMTGEMPKEGGKPGKS